MAKVKSAKEKITAYLKGKGLSMDDIRDAFDELDAADQDLDSLAGQITDYRTKNEQWTNWYQQVAPEVQTAMAEREQLRAQVDRLKAAGVNIDVNVPAAAKIEQTQAGGISANDLAQFKQDVLKATNQVQKALSKIQIRHYKNFNEEADLDAIEKVMSERGMTNPEDAYETWVAPKMKARNDEDYKKKLDEGIRLGIQNELSKQGIARTRKRTDDIAPAPLTKEAPTDRELRDAFISDINSMADGVAH